MMATSLRAAAQPSAATRPTRGVGFTMLAGRQRRPTWIVLGVLLVLGAGLGVALWSTSVTDRRLVLVTSHAVEAGQRIERDDLREVAINADAALTAVASAQIDTVVGRTAQAPIPAGTPVQLAMVADAVRVPAGKVVVGASLGAGEYPTSGMRAGDAVTLIETTNNAPTGTTSRVLGSGTVWSVEHIDSGGQARLFVSIVVEDAQGAAVANASASNRLRLLLGAGQ